MHNKESDAVFAQAGACNPVALANSFLTHAKPILHETGTDAVCNDPALRLIVHQLAHLMRLSEFDLDLSAYGDALEHCEKHQS